MTVAELIAKLQEFPLDAKVDFTADQGFIGTDSPEFDLVYGGTPQYPEEPTLYITID